MNPWGLPRREVPSAGVGLTSLLDVLVILVLFLLSVYGPVEADPRLDEGLSLPRSTATRVPAEGLRIRITRETLFLNGRPIVGLEEGPVGPRIPGEFKEGRLVPVLHEHLLGASEGGARSLRGEPVVLEGDQDLPFAVLREVMYTAQEAGFHEFHLLVLGSEALRPSPGGVPR
ncbi:MAG: biopolymer transporter ExbD [Deltaproteobacteria bacterium]|nr:biopolymer transporter ExbD [Deltaproteobacteria bacterium]